MSGKSNKKRLAALLFVACLAVIVFLLVNMMHGKTTTTGQYPEPHYTFSITCTSDSILYPFIEYDNSIKKELKAVATFFNDKVNSLSISQELFYDSERAIIDSDNVNHVQISSFLQANGISESSIGVNYARLSDRFRVSMYTTEKKFTDKMAPYFMLDSAEILRSGTLEDYRRHYESLGLICKTTEI